MKSVASECGHIAMIRGYVGFQIEESLRDSLDNVTDEELKEVARRWFFDLSTGCGDTYLLERAWLMAAVNFIPGVVFSFPHIDQFIHG